MGQNNIHILSTRPVGNHVVQLARQHGMMIDCKSFIETTPVTDQDVVEEIRKYAGEQMPVIFTSMNAADAVIDVLDGDGITPQWTIFTMGGTTKKTVHDFFTESDVHATATNAAQLAQEVIEEGCDEVVFFCGNQRRDELPDMLRDEGIVVNEVVVYETAEVPLKLDRNYDGILFFSPSAVRSFFASNKVADNTVLFAIGQTTAQSLRQLSTNKVITGHFPEKEQLAQEAIRFFATGKHIAG